MPGKKAHVKNEKQYEKLKERGMSKERAARIANSPDASSRGGKKSGSDSGRRLPVSGDSPTRKHKQWWVCSQKLWKSAGELHTGLRVQEDGEGSLIVLLPARLLGWRIGQENRRSS
jgi:hypothetical protein